MASTGFSGLSDPGWAALSSTYWLELRDAGRSFMWALGAIPDYAPVGQDHLLRSSSVVQKITYGPSHDRVPHF